MHKVAVIVGSIRRESFNKKLAQALVLLAADRLDLRVLRIDDLPLFNQDDEQSPPPAVQRLKQEIRACAGVLFVTPEHNRSVPAALKNAFDWASRPVTDNAWEGKPAAIIGTSRGRISTAVAQSHLRTIASGHFTALMATPEAYIQYSDELLAEDGTVKDERARRVMQRFLNAFASLLDALAPRAG
jgi:chromate reductase